MFTFESPAFNTVHNHAYNLLAGNDFVAMSQAQAYLTDVTTIIATASFVP